MGEPKSRMQVDRYNGQSSSQFQFQFQAQACDTPTRFLGTNEEVVSPCQPRSLHGLAIKMETFEGDPKLQREPLSASCDPVKGLLPSEKSGLPPKEEPPHRLQDRINCFRHMWKTPKKPSGHEEDEDSKDQLLSSTCLPTLPQG
jgi:hypothetical protein